jgi:hypothetical protein
MRGHHGYTYSTRRGLGQAAQNPPLSKIRIISSSTYIIHCAHTYAPNRCFLHVETSYLVLHIPLARDHGGSFHMCISIHTCMSRQSSTNSPA